MQSDTVALVVVIVILTAALVLVGGVTWRLNAKVNDLESELRVVDPVRASKDVFWNRGKPPAPFWRLNITYGAFYNDPNEPEKVKQVLERMRRDGRDDAARVLGYPK